MGMNGFILPMTATHNTPKGTIFQFTLPTVGDEVLPSKQTYRLCNPNPSLPSKEAM